MMASGKKSWHSPEAPQEASWKERILSLEVFVSIISDYVHIYIYIYGEGWGFPGMELYVIEMEFENVHFTLVFTVFYGFVSIHRSIESVGCCADKLRVCPRRKTIFQSSFDMDKNPCFIFPIGTMVSGFF